MQLFNPFSERPVNKADNSTHYACSPLRRSNSFSLFHHLPPSNPSNQPWSSPTTFSLLALLPACWGGVTSSWCLCIMCGVFMCVFHLSLCLCVCVCVCECQRDIERECGKERRLFSDGTNCFFDPVISGRRHSEGAGDEAPMARFQHGRINYHLWSTNGLLSCPLRPRSSTAEPGHLLSVVSMEWTLTMRWNIVNLSPTEDFPCKLEV